MPPEVIASFRGVNKTYDGVNAVVENLDLDVRRGEFLTLLGPSGSGKTTTLMMLAGFETPSSGEITINNRNMRDVPPYRRNIGVVFQSYALFPNMSVAENLAYPLRRRRLDKGEITTTVADALEKVRMTPFSARFPAQLSGGQQQRVALARALIFRPDMVLMDEPLGALDRKLREEMQGEIRAIHARSGTTIVYVTHDQDEALAMSDRIAVFNEGAIRQLGSPREIYETPADLFVAGFVGENNRFDAAVESWQGEFASVLVDGQAFRVRSGGRSAAGNRAFVCVRPEDMLIAPDEQGLPVAFASRVEDIVYLGDHARVILAADRIGTFVAKVAAGVRAEGYRVGERVSASFIPERAIAFPLSRSGGD